ncbi:MAG: hypothetical protein IT289_03720 [Oligoflexia bacterium]|nr:hypothetical protein [Oligoflexia bacterium]
MSQTTTSRTELIDSLMHQKTARLAVGILAGLAAGAVFLLITVVLKPSDRSALWWPQLLSTVCFGGQGLSFDAPFSVYALGLVMHFSLAGLCGLIVGKMTTGNDLAKLTFYGFVLGLLCWLATNMFGPNVMFVESLREVGQWTRAAFFIPFGVCVGVFLGIGAKSLNT